KILLFGISRQVLERHDRERRNPRRWRPTAGHPLAGLADAGADQDPDSSSQHHGHPHPALQPRWARRRSLCHTFGIITAAGDWRDESVAFARQRLDEARLFSRISQRFPEMIDGLVQPAIEVDEGLRAPEPAR